MKYLVFVFLCFCLSCSPKKQLISIGNGSCAMEYKVNKIEIHKSYYIIYAQRNDSTFKVISDKENNNSSCKKIKVNKTYKLDLKKTFPMDSIFGFALAPGLEVKGLEMPDGSVVEIEMESHYKLYRSSNLYGLCVQW